jgi:hypothetical protein
MTGKLKIQLDSDLGQPKRFLSIKVQNGWQVKKEEEEEEEVHIYNNRPM